MTWTLETMKAAIGRKVRFTVTSIATGEWVTVDESGTIAGWMLDGYDDGTPRLRVIVLCGQPIRGSYSTEWVLSEWVLSESLVFTGGEE